LTLTYGTTVLDLSGALGPDAPINWGEFGEGSIRRSYAGTARLYKRWDKRTVSLTWSGISSTEAQQLRSAKNSGTTLVLTLLPPAVTDAINGTLYMLYQPASYSLAESGFNMYDLSMTLEEI
jgi:hypothetical protein